MSEIKKQKILEVHVSKNDTSLYDYYDRILTLISEIRDAHIEFSKKVQDMLHLNLKRTKVYHMFLDDQIGVISEDYYKYIISYVEKINELSIYLEFEYHYSDLDLSMRVKQKESITNKLNHYRYGKKEAGRVPLNKCLNDLLGVRIILKDFNHDCSCFLELCEAIEDIDGYKIKVEDSTKNGYVATHVYFYGKGNFSFPWELQIWSRRDDENNKESHYEHKQSYTKWAEQYKGSVETESIKIKTKGGI